MKLCPKCGGRLMYETLDDAYTCLACGKMVYPELISLEEVEALSGLSREELLTNLRVIYEPVRQGLVHRRVLGKLESRIK